MKEVKDIILERRIRKWEIEGKKVPQIYLDVFNDYLEEIAEEFTDYTKQVRKEVCEEIKSAIKEKLTYPDNRVDCPFDNGYPDEDTICSVLDQIQGENCCYGKI